MELELAQKKGVSRTVSNGPAPIAASHQRLLSLKQSEIQERLIKNKTLLNVVEPTLTNHSLDLFLGILQRRIELDKEALFQFSQLKRDQPAKPGAAEQTNIVIAPILMKYSHGCQQVNKMQINLLLLLLLLLISSTKITKGISRTDRDSLGLCRTGRSTRPSRKPSARVRCRDSHFRYRKELGRPLNKTDEPIFVVVVFGSCFPFFAAAVNVSARLAKQWKHFQRKPFRSP